MTTFAEVIGRTRRRLMGQQREPVNSLAVSITNADTSLSFTSTVRIVENTRLSIELEDMHVIAVAGGGSGATVVRGLDGSPAAAHNAPAQVQVGPTWTNWDIAQAINDELADLSSPVNGLFRVASIDFTFDPSKSGYELVGLQDFLDVWRVRYNTPGPSDDWPIIPRGLWRIDRAADTTDFASGVQLVLLAGGSPGDKVRVTYKRSYDPLVNWTDDVLAVSGLHNEAHDLLSIGAAWRLMAASESQRSYTTGQADPRRSAEAPAPANARAMQSLAVMRDSRIRSEQARLARMYPEALP